MADIQSEGLRPILAVNTDSATDSEGDNMSVVFTPTSIKSEMTIDINHPSLVAWRKFAERMDRDNEDDVSKEVRLVWADIEQKMEVTDFYDTGLSVEEQNLALSKDIDRKMAITDAVDKGLTSEEQNKALWEGVERKMAVIDAFDFGLPKKDEKRDI